MSLYKRGRVWWYHFRFAGQEIQESTRSKSKTIARDAERARRRTLEQDFNRIEKRRAAQYSPETWLASKKAHLAPRSVAIAQATPFSERCGSVTFEARMSRAYRIDFPRQ